MAAAFTPSFAKNVLRRSLRAIVDPHPKRAEIEHLWSFFDSRCAYCGKHIEGGAKDAHLDHLDSESNGGVNHISNRVPACASCNEAEKREQDWEVFLKAKAVGDCYVIRRDRIVNWQNYFKDATPAPSPEQIQRLEAEIENVISTYDLALERIRSLHDNGLLASGWPASVKPDNGPG